MLVTSIYSSYNVCRGFRFVGRQDGVVKGLVEFKVAKILDGVENIVGKRENIGHQHYHHFQQYSSVDESLD